MTIPLAPTTATKTASARGTTGPAAKAAPFRATGLFTMATAGAAGTIPVRPIATRALTAGAIALWSVFPRAALGGAGGTTRKFGRSGATRGALGLAAGMDTGPDWRSVGGFPLQRTAERFQTTDDLT